MKKRRKPSHQNSTNGVTLHDGGLAAGLLLLVLLVVGDYKPYWIPAGSMKPALLIGDYIFVNVHAYPSDLPDCTVDACPERGDVIVFKHPVRGDDYIKRLIGLPGDSVQIIGGLLYINGIVAPQETITPFIETYEKQGPVQGFPRCSNMGPAFGGECLKNRAVEVLPNGVALEVLSLSSGMLADDTVEFLVPEGHYFFMGDNRDNSIDSRFPQQGYAPGVGMVPHENIIGRADWIIFSSAGKSLAMFWTWRQDRFLKAIE